MTEVNNRNGENGTAPAGGTRFAVGDRVADRDGDGTSAARVLDPDVGRADQVELGNTGQSVSDKNEQYPPDDRVVRVAFDSDLQVLPEDKNGSIAERVEEFAANWGVNIRTYDYPESRLIEL
ncbi:hypothetical protein [Haloarcula marismortui]|uniref:Uncharacterized protein n=1 Tax=Haloarcula marismortui ATCC 33799 TaxID=662475 RepID=M0KUI7_9EURY|nr:hypothetical protein [Haloarcula californiae]EMA24891.1 hypothetical protein C435_03323 [Haloarcula californiae ATCC 33799]